MTVDMSMNVLIVDDDKTVLKVMHGLLGKIGFTKVSEATDGTVAIDLMKYKRFGLVISDWNMEPMDGLELIKNIRANDDIHKEVPFIMITAESKTDDDLITAKQAGINNYIVKPFDADTLKQRIVNVLGEF